MYILGINESHTATAAILKDGEIIACASEERFVRKKSVAGFPKNAVKFCLKEAGISSSDVDLVVFSFINPCNFLIELQNQKTKSFFNYVVSAGSSWIINFVMLFSANLPGIFYKIFEFLYDNLYKIFAWWKLVPLHMSFLEKELNINRDKFFFLDHHTAHAFGPFYAYPRNDDEKYLVITNDGRGDKVCGRVFTVKDNNWQEIASSSNNSSLGWLYAFTTQLMGFKLAEHEYKVMGLAPYASKDGVDRTYKVFKNLIWLDGLSFKSKIPRIGYFSYLKKNLFGFRFDYIAGGVQKITEELLTQQIINAVKTTGIQNIVVGGGTFMNVKANMEISHLSNIKEYTIMPSGGDESTAIGACYFGYKKLCKDKGLKFNPKPIKNCYLGPSFKTSEIEKAFKAEKIIGNDHYKIDKMENPSKTIAKLLRDGNVVARFAGKMEFGARALGNRSLLANPSDARIIKIINDQIKGRDFWMPFAPVVLKEKLNDYFVIPKAAVSNEYMMIAYKTKPEVREKLTACLHPYDFTARPQVLSKEMNPGYYYIIKEFKNLTGIGLLLNTSFNIHGEPIVCTPVDAIRTLKKSGLEYLAIEDYLVKKVIKIS